MELHSRFQFGDDKKLRRAQERKVDLELAACGLRALLAQCDYCLSRKPRALITE